MSEQLSFDGFDSDRPTPPVKQRPRGGFEPRDMLLFATYLEESAALAASELARTLIAGQDRRAKPQSNLHITLHPLGDAAAAPERLLNMLLRAGSSIARARFAVGCERVMRWGKADTGPLVMLPGEGRAELVDLQRAIRSAIDSVAPGLFPKWAFTPHVTLARTRMIGEQAIAPIRWTVGEFALVRSVQARGEHLVLGRWPLRP